MLKLVKNAPPDTNRRRHSHKPLWTYIHTYLPPSSPNPPHAYNIVTPPRNLTKVRRRGGGGGGGGGHSKMACFSCVGVDVYKSSSRRSKLEVAWQRCVFGREITKWYFPLMTKASPRATVSAQLFFLRKLFKPF